MKEIVIAQPLGITRELLESLVSGLKKEGWNLTAYDKVPSGQEELGKRIEGADIAVIANYPLKKEALEKPLPSSTSASLSPVSIMSISLTARKDILPYPTAQAIPLNPLLNLPSAWRFLSTACFLNAGKP